MLLLWPKNMLCLLFWVIYSSLFVAAKAGILRICYAFQSASKRNVLEGSIVSKHPGWLSNLALAGSGLVDGFVAASALLMACAATLVSRNARTGCSS